MNNKKSKKLLVIGATSFVGRRFCRYLIESKFHNEIDITFSARNKNKFDKIFSGAKLPNNIQFHLLDTYEAKAVDQIVSQNNIVCNFAGPFTKYAPNVVESCAKHGVHYLDITGEINFVRDMIKKHESTAQSTGASIIPFCGFDSVPSDLAVYLIKNKIFSLHNEKVKNVHTIYNAKGGINGGTIASAFEAISKIPQDDINNLHYLCPNERAFYPPLNGKSRTSYNGKYVTPFFMEPINNKVVYRTKYLNKHEGYAKNFIYLESMYTTAKFSFLTSKILQLSLDLSDLIMKTQKLSKFVRNFLPKPGEGPSEKLIETGFFKAQVIGTSESGKIETIQIEAQGDPGNKATANLILLCLKCLIETPTPPPGFQTPVTCFGDKILKYSKDFKIFIKDK